MNGFTGIETGRKDRIVGLFSQAHSLAISGDYKEALRLYDRIIAEIPGIGAKTPQINYERALCLKALGRIGQAEQAVCACLAAKPEHPDSLRLLSETRSIKKIGDDAKRRLETQPGVTIIDNTKQAHQLSAEVKTFLPLVEEADVRQALKAISLIEKRIIGRYCGGLGDKVLQYLSIVQFVRATSSNTVDSIEIGTLFGGSCLTKLFAMRDLGVGGKVICIYPMSGYYGQPIDPYAGIAVTAKVFFENVTRFGFPKESVELREVKSNNPRGIEGLREKSYATLMIDGDHSYNGVRFDWETYSRFVSDKGIVLFDDYANRDWPDIGIFVNELKGSLPRGWKELGCLGTTLLLGRVSGEVDKHGKKSCFIHEQAEQVSNEIHKKVKRSSSAVEPAKANSLVTHQAGVGRKFSELGLLLELDYPSNRKSVLVDVGAHVGSFSKPYAERGWQVFAFEPEAANYQEFRRNLCAFPKVTCIKKAVSDISADKVPFYHSSEHWGIHSLKPFHPTHHLAGTVETIRLDEVLDQLQIDHVTILKIDVEGADFMALRSFDFNKLQPEVVICEFMDERSVPNFGYTHHDIANYMTERGYTAFISEWAPIKEYGRKDFSSEPHKFLRCGRYLRDSNPAWGNLIFVPQSRAEHFEHALSAYLRELGIPMIELRQVVPPRQLEPAAAQYQGSLHQEEVLKASNALLTKYKNKHRGQRCIIIGNGPSLNKMDLSFLKNEITFGMNRIYLLFDKWNFRPSYYVSVNPLVIEQSAEQICKITSPKFLGLNGLPYIQNHRDTIFLQSIRSPSFSNDPRNGLWEGHTVTYVAMQLAYFMGFSEVILIGVDHYFKSQGPANKEVISDRDDQNHFHPHYFGKGVRWHLPDLAKSEVAYSLAKQAFEADGRRIVDATVDGHLTIFPKADYKQVFLPASLITNSGELVLNAALIDTEFEEYVRDKNENLNITVRPKFDPLVPVEPHREYLVSAIVSTYNSERFVRGCLDDLEQQTIADKLEIIVVNSGSQENEEAIVREYRQKYNNIIYLKTEQREGIYSAWNRAISVARGTFLTNANTDDRHRNDALEIMTKTLLENPYIALVYGDQICTDTRNGTFADHHATEMAKRPEYSRERLFFGCCVGSQPMWRKSLHDELGHFDESLDDASDWDFWLRISSKYKFKHIPDFLGFYYFNKHGIEHGRKIHSLYERYIVGRRYGNPYISVIPVYKSKDNPLVSVIMPAYNAAEHIAEAIESVLIQNYRNFELIVVDDGSTDNTKDIVAGFKDDRIKYFYKDNSGPSGTRNLAICKAMGQYIMPLDADDMMTPDFIARHLMEFEKHPEADLVYCDVLLIDDRSNPIRIMNKPEYQDRRHLIRDLFRAGHPVLPFRLGIRRSVFDKIGFYDEDLLVGEDYDMMRRFIKAGLKAHHLNEALHLRRTYSESLSRNYSSHKTKCHFDVVRRFTNTFTYEELFPDVAWDEIPVDARRLHAKCLAVVTYLAIGQDFSQSNSARIYAKTAFEQACLELRECLEIDPDNRQIRELLQKCELGRQRYEQQVQQAVC